MKMKLNVLRKMLLPVTLCLVLVLVLVFYFAVFPSHQANFLQNKTSMIYANTTSNTLPSNTKDGVVLHAFDWSFNTIKNELPNIVVSGYKSIQVSPVQGTKDSSTDASKWWLLYQPTNESVGNAQLGTYDDFKSLCTTAKSYGISIIVDVVMNHMANNGNSDQLDSSVDSSFKDSSLYHNLGQCTNWNDRNDITQQGIGMPDLNTQSTAVQNKAITFLNQCIDAGASGFRFDAAKHIETNIGLDANESWSGNYWTNVLGNLHNNSSLFIYGEILQDGTVDNISSYETFMNVTASTYGYNLRTAITSNNLSGANGIGGLNPSKSVDFVETHDTYENGTSSSLTPWQIKMGWAIAASRSGATPLFFDRPTSTLGNKGDSLWKDTDVVSINQFHNAMVGQNEYLRWTNNNQTMLIDRGTIGTVIVNAGVSTYLNSSTNLANGTYTNHGSASTTLTVSNGTITGTIPGNSIITLYNTNPTLTASANITAGIYYSAQSVTLTASKIANIYYTTDGSTPTSLSTLYTGPINIASSLTLKFIVIDSTGISSPVYTDTYIISTTTAYIPHSSYSDGRWMSTITIPTGNYALNMSFKNQDSTWDSNNSSNYNFSSTQ